MESQDVKVENNEREGSPSPSPKPPSPPPPPPAGYDPNRIPSSVFSSKSGPEWSGASNDSLFSIPMGNNSFSNDYAIMYGKSGDFDPNAKSGELPRLDEWSNNNRPAAAPAKPGEGSGLAPVMEHEEGSLQSGEMSSRAGKRSPQQSPPAASFRPPDSPARNPRISDVSATSNMSFAFPVLVSESRKKEESLDGAPATAKGESRPSPPQAQAHKPNNRWFSCFSCAWPKRC